MMIIMYVVGKIRMKYQGCIYVGYVLFLWFRYSFRLLNLEELERR